MEQFVDCSRPEREQVIPFFFISYLQLDTDADVMRYPLRILLIRPNAKTSERCKTILKNLILKHH
jgi:hypothetical protein